MPVFNHRFTVRASLEAVRAFHQGDAGTAFKALAPPGTPVTFSQPMSVMTDGAVLEFTMWMGGVVPIRWKALHSNVTTDGFVDTMTEGPVKSWKHTHRFLAMTDASTAVEDHIVYEYGPGARGSWSIFKKVTPHQTRKYTPNLFSLSTACLFPVTALCRVTSRVCLVAIAGVDNVEVVRLGPTPSVCPNGLCG
eukprot:3098785-Amphidinium_carterae.1